MNLAPARRQTAAGMRFFSASLRGLVVAGLLLVLGVSMAGGEEATTARAETLPVDGENCTAMNRVLADYASRAAQLRQQVLKAHSLDYGQVVASAYPAGVITHEILEAKAAWRARLATRGAFTLLADYRLCTVPAVVEDLAPSPDSSLHSTLVARYEAVGHWIGLSSAASDFCVFHEAGHTLQRDALRARGTRQMQRAASHATDDPFEARLQSSQADAMSIARLRYLSSHDEFEVRLQDLNRFYAVCVAGKPILSPLDSLRALLALGMPLDYAEVSAAFVAGRETLSSSQFSEMITSTRSAPATAGGEFEDAQELRLLRRLAMRVDPDCWPHLLAKIIFESPAHL